MDAMVAILKMLILLHHIGKAYEQRTLTILLCMICRLEWISDQLEIQYGCHFDRKHSYHYTGHFETLLIANFKKRMQCIHEHLTISCECNYIRNLW